MRRLFHFNCNDVNEKNKTCVVCSPGKIENRTCE